MKEEVEESIQEINIFDLILDILDVVVLKRKLIFGIFTTFSLVFSLYFFLNAPVYKSEFIISSSVVSSERISIIIDPLGKLVEENNYSELAQLLKIDSATATQIVSISAKEIKDETKHNSNSSYSTEEMRQQNCLITLKVKNDPKFYNLVEAGILSYLRMNDYVFRKSETDMNNLRNMKNRIKKEIKELDSLKQTINMKSTSLMMLDPSAINNSIANLYQQEQNIDTRIKLDDGGINMIRHVPRFKKPVAPKFFIYLILDIVVSLFVSVIVIFFEKAIVRKRLRNNLN